MTTKIPKELDPKQNPTINAIFDALTKVIRKIAYTGLIGGTATIRNYSQKDHVDFAMVKRLALSFGEDPADVIFPVMINAFVNKDKLALFSTKGEPIPGKRMLTAYDASTSLAAFAKVNGSKHYLHPVTMQPMMKVIDIFPELVKVIKQFEEECIFRVIMQLNDQEATKEKEAKTAFIDVLFLLKSDFENGNEDAKYVAGVRIDGPIRANLNRLFLQQRKKGKEQLNSILAKSKTAPPKK